MLVNKTIEMPDGTVTFEGKLEKEELDTVIMCGLNYLLAMGALRPTIIESGDEDNEQLELDLENDNDTPLQ